MNMMHRVNQASSRVNLTHKTIPHIEFEVKILAQDQSEAFQAVNIFKRNFKVIQTDSLSKGFTVIKDVREI